jgi:maltose O-acetyltransferase
MLLRLIGGLLDLPVRLRDRIYVARMRGRCRADATSTLAPDAAIFNPLDPGAVTIGEQSLVMSELLVIAPRGRIRIGGWCYLGPGAKLWAMDSIHLGDRVFVSHGVQVFDNNSHSLSAQERHDRYHELRTAGRHLVPENVVSRPIVIEDDVWIGFNAAILKGVTVGRGAVIGACSVVTHDVPPYAVVVGNPARQVGESRP